MSERRSVRSEREDSKDGDGPSIQTVEMKPYTSLTLDLGSKRDVTRGSFTILSGSAELAGAILKPKVEYKVTSKQTWTLFSWKGCQVEVKGRVQVSTSDYCPNTLILKLHALLEYDRAKAAEEEGKGPRVMLLGDYDSGKTTVVTTLLNYAVLMGRSPIYVSLDVRHGDFCVPGTLGAGVVSALSDEMGRFHAFEEPPLMYHFGHAYIAANKNYYSFLVNTLAKNLTDSSEKNPNVKASGMVIDANADIKDSNYAKIAQTFEVSHVVVIENEIVYNEMCREMPPFVEVIFLPRLSGQIVRRDRHDLYARADFEVLHYFGERDVRGEKVVDNVKSTTLTVGFDDVKVFSIEENRHPKKNEPEFKLTSLRIKEKMQKRLLAISAASSKDDILSSNILGYVCVMRVDSSKDQLELKVPKCTALPGKFLLVGDGTYNESA